MRKTTERTQRVKLKKVEEEVFILHEHWQKHNCPVCGETFIVAHDGFIHACKHLRFVDLDLAGDPFYVSHKKSKRLVTYLITDSPGPHGGTLTVKVDLGSLKGNPEELYWKFNKRPDAARNQ